MKRIFSFVLALAMALSLAACNGGVTAATMHLRRAEGRVVVSDGGGKDVPLLDDLGLYSGYEVNTRSESYAWIDLDDVKLTKMDQNSKISIQKEGKALEIEVRSGSLFFNVTEPLEDDETMNISVSTMLVGIRGTCGWVEENNGRPRMYLLEGRVDCSAEGLTVRVYAGEMVELQKNGDLDVKPFAAKDVPAFILDEVAEDDDLAQAILDDSGIDVLNPVDPVADALEQYRVIISQADTYVYDEYSDGTGDISYYYALVQMRPEDAVPTLLIEQVSNSFYGSYGYARVFQYDPESGTVRQPDGVVMEGVASAGGYRGSLSMMGDGNGICEESWFSGTGDGSVDRVTLEGGSLLRTRVWEGMIFDETGSKPSTNAIDWHDISDAGALDGWASGAGVTTPQPEPGQPSTPVQLPADGDRIVFTGTINSYTYDEVLALQGESDPNPGPYNVERSWTFRLIVLDTPQTMSLRSGGGDGFREGTVTLISVTGSDRLGQYDGQRLIFSIDPSQTRWPSDTSLPLGEPRTGDVHVLGPAPAG